MAIVLDIDETSLSNYRDMVLLNFGGTYHENDLAEAKGTDAVIAPTLKLYQFAKAHGVAVFFITGRHQRYQQPTLANLKQAGYEHFDGLVLKPNFYHDKTVVHYKAQAREYLVKRGYDVVLNIGDQESDLAGGFADKTFLMPNPYYFIP